MIWLIPLLVTVAFAALRLRSPSQVPVVVVPAVVAAPVPLREPTPVEHAAGLLMALVAVASLVPQWLDGHDGGLAGPLVTPVGTAACFFLAAVVAAGERGRKRLATALFDSNRQYIGARRYRITTKKTDALRALGPMPRVALGLLVVGAVLCLLKPIITPAQERFEMKGIPSRFEAAMMRAAAAGDRDARSLMGASSHFELTGYTSERNVAWPVSGLVLLGLAAMVSLTAGSRRSAA